jgi:ferrochelatase
MAGRTAVILFNLGGPDNLAAVKPFLFNLFNDRAIIDLPGPVRWLLAKFISARRAPVARAIYQQIGGASPLLENTRKQARALEERFDKSSDVRCFIAMRYWAPRADDTAREVKAFAPNQVVLLPLYPQYSGTTTGSSIDDWRRAAAAAGIDAPTTTICCYAQNREFVAAVTDRVRDAMVAAKSAHTPPRVLFCAHGLPQKIVDRGDPYQWMVERSVAAVVDKLAIEGLDWRICYQSRVGRLAWLKPYTVDELKAAGRDRVPVVIVPIAFTSEHSETLVELDIDYAKVAAAARVPNYIRVQTVGVDAEFIDGLAGLVRVAVARPGAMLSDGGARCCPQGLTKCVNGMGARRG